MSCDCGYNLGPGGGDGTKHAKMERRKAKRHEVAQKRHSWDLRPHRLPGSARTRGPTAPLCASTSASGPRGRLGCLRTTSACAGVAAARARTVEPSVAPGNHSTLSRPERGERRNDSRWRRTWTSSWMRSSPSFADQTHSDWAWSSGPEAVAAAAASSATTGTEPKRKRISG